MPTYQRTLIEQLNALPPFVAFALARKNGKRPKLEELASASGLPERTFVRIARRITWDNVKAAQIDAFCRACNVDILRQNKDRAFLRKTLGYKHAMSHLSPQQLRTFNEQCGKWKAIKATSPQPEP